MPRDAMGRFIPDPANDKGESRSERHKLWAARAQLGLGKYEGRYCYYVEDILGAMPGTVKDIAEKTGLPYRSVWNRVQVLHSCDWIHVGDTREHPNGGPMCPIYYAGQGYDFVEDESKYVVPSAPIKLDPNRKANPFDALLGYGT